MRGNPNLNFKFRAWFWEQGLWVCVVLQACFLGYLQYQLWLSADGRPELMRLTEQVSQQRHDNARLALRNNLLKEQITMLKTPGPALEGRARLDLGLIKSGETLFLLTQE